MQARPNDGRGAPVIPRRIGTRLSNRLTSLPAEPGHPAKPADPHLRPVVFPTIGYVLSATSGSVTDKKPAAARRIAPPFIPLEIRNRCRHPPVAPAARCTARPVLWWIFTAVK
jgi:hypothetical protein